MTKNSKQQNNTAMKDSGIDWIGEIPSDWIVRRGKFVFKSKKQINKGMICDNVLSLTMRGVISRSELGEGGLVPRDYSTFQLFKKDDLVFKLIDLENYKTSRVGLVHENGIMSSAYIRIMPKFGQDLSVKYFYNFYYNLYLEGIYNFIGMGVRSTMNYSDLLNLDIIIPPKQMQQKIVEFLDEKTGAVGELVEKKKKMIELLKEKRSSLITHAVTCGLDENGNLRQKPKSLPATGWKDSGVEWVGETPSGWEVKKLKYLFKSILHKRKSKNQISLENIESWTGRYIKTDSEYNGDGVFCIKGDILFGKLRPYLAKVFLIKKSREALGDLLVYRPMSEIVSEFGHKMLLSKNIIDYINASTYGTKMPRVNPDFVRSLEMIYPPKQSQQKIVDFLDKKTSEIDSIISKIEKQIKLLEEYKASLIYHTVTGKIEV